MIEHSDIIDVQIQGSNLVLDSGLLMKLGATPGDRILIGYTEKEGNMIPIIMKNDDGNKLTNKNTVRFSGKQADVLAQFGSCFWAGEFNGSYCELKGNGIPVYSDIKKAVNAYFSKEIVLDTNYDINYLDNFEF